MTETETRHGQRLSVRAWALIEDAAAAVGIQPGVHLKLDNGAQRVGAKTSINGVLVITIFF